MKQQDDNKANAKGTADGNLKNNARILAMPENADRLARTLKSQTPLAPLDLRITPPANEVTR